MLSRERGWGVKGDTFLCLQAMGQLGEPTWFHTGDRDLAMHLLRSRLLAEGKTLSEATTVDLEKLGVKARVLPMSDSRVETRVDTPSGELSFEEYFVQRWYQDPGELGALRRSLRRRACAGSASKPSSPPTQF
jgi:LPPG:FO 2-phospho-L-lactate transferase